MPADSYECDSREDLHEDSYGRSTIVQQFLEGQLVVDIVHLFCSVNSVSADCKTTEMAPTMVQKIAKHLSKKILKLKQFGAPK